MTDHLAVLQELAQEMRYRAGDCYDLSPCDADSWADRLTAAIALMRGQSWQPIETAPKEEGLKILGASNAPWTQDYYPVLVYEGQRFGSNKQYFGWHAPFDHDDRAPDPTHWQPLPAPPKDSADEQ